jgi:hypothetical protein
MKRNDACVILGISEPDSFHEDLVRKAYLKRAMQWHPDRHCGSGDAASKTAKEEFQGVSVAYQRLRPNKGDDDDCDEEDACSATPDNYMEVFEKMYEKYAPALKSYMESPEIKLMKGVYGSIKSVVMRKKADKDSGMREEPGGEEQGGEEQGGEQQGGEQQGGEEQGGEEQGGEQQGGEQQDGEEKDTTMQPSTSLNITQRITVPLQEVFDREIKKIVVKQFRWNAASQQQEAVLLTAILPLEHQEVCFPGEGDSTATHVGDLNIVVSTTDGGTFCRDTADSTVLRCSLRISPYDMCFGGGKYVLPHFNRPIIFQIGEQYFKRCHRSIVLPSFGLWSHERQSRSNLIVSVRVDEDDANLARKALFQSLYADGSISDDANVDIVT